MDIAPYLAMARKQLWLVATIAVLAAIVAYAVSSVLPPVWEGSVEILVKPAQPLTTSDPGVSALTSDQVSRTYARLMTEPPLLQQVVADLGLKMTPSQLGGSIKIQPQPNTTILDVTVQSTNRTLARDIANTLVDDFIANTKKLQDQQTAAFTATIRTQITDTLGSINKNQQRLSELTSLSSQKALPSDQAAEMSLLQQQLSVERSQYASLLGSLTTIESDNARSRDNLLIVSRATLPDGQVAPRPLRNTLLAFVAGLLLGALLVAAREYFDKSIRSDEDLLARTGLVSIGHVPFIPSAARSRGELMSLGAQSTAIEAYKTIRTNLLFSSIEKDLKTLLVTSSVPGEGKSRTAANLAVVLAQAGYRTLLIDADFRRPTQHRIFGRRRNIGLSNMILQDSPDNQLLTPDEEIPNLWLLPSGPTPPNPSELLGSGKMQNLIERFRKSFTYIVLDSPPIAAVTDALVLAGHADGVLVVIHHGMTGYPTVNRTVQALSRIGANILGAVVNKDRRADQFTYYGYEPTAREPAAPMPVGLKPASSQKAADQ